MPVILICEICKKEYSVKPYRKETSRFCSKICGGKWHQSQRPNMGNRFKKGNKLRKGIKPANAFTSEQVKGKGSINWIDGNRYTCEYCSKDFHIKPWKERQNGKPRFCSRECFGKSKVFVGEKSPCYVGGKKTYRGRNWEKARHAAIDRDNGICQLCRKKVGKSIPVHHKEPFRNFESSEQANMLDNLICLCNRCHMKVENSELDYEKI